MEAGLIEHWKLNTWIRMKEETRLRAETLDVSEMSGKDDVKALALDDLQSAFMLCGVLLTVAILTALGELLVGIGTLPRDSDNTQPLDDSRQVNYTEQLKGAKQVQYAHRRNQDASYHRRPHA